MKRLFFSTLLFSVLLLFALNLRGDISYTSQPSVGVANSSFTKYIDILTGAENWHRDWLSGTVTVYVSAGMSGVGQGQGTLTNISLLGNSIGTYQDSVSDAGSKSTDGSWSSGMGSASAHYPASIPPSAKTNTSYSWSTGGYTVIWPFEWHESTSWGVSVNVPTGVSGRYTTTGGWAHGTTIRRDANSAQGTITLDVQHKCSKCRQYGDTAAAIGGKSAHEKITCPAPTCSEQYHKCSPPSGHAICDGCGKRKCEGGDHDYLSRCNGEYVHYTKWVAGCGEKIYRCTRSQHQAQTYDCGDTMKACQYASHSCTPSTPSMHACGDHETSVSGDHSQRTYTCGQDYGYKCQESDDHKTYISSCSSTKDGKTCDNSSGYYECSPHGHTYPSSSDDDSSDTTTCSAGHVYKTTGRWASYLANLHRDRTCRFSGCGNSWQACSISGWSPLCNNAYRKSKGWKCGAQ